MAAHTDDRLFKTVLVHRGQQLLDAATSRGNASKRIDGHVGHVFLRLAVLPYHLDLSHL